MVCILLQESPMLRLARLARIVKIVRKVPQLQVIVMGCLGGFRSIMYILLLLMLVFYLYAVIGILMFRPNDPFHFEFLTTAMVTMFRCTTLEDWTGGGSSLVPPRFSRHARSRCRTRAGRAWLCRNAQCTYAPAAAPAPAAPAPAAPSLT
jgi:hypothetical protein